MPNWTDSNKIYDPIDNKTVQMDFIDTMTAELPIFEAYYDPANVEVDGKGGTYYGGQMPQDGPIKWSDEWMFNRWPKSEEFDQTLPLVQYGLFGDRSSKDFGRLAFEQPNILKKHLDSKVNNVYGQWKKSVQEVILHDLCNKNNFKVDAIEELDKDYFEISDDPDQIATNQAKAISLVAKIEKRMYEMLYYTNKYNKADKQAAVPSLKDLDLILDYEVNTFLNTYGYSQVFNVNYIDLKQKVGRVIIVNLPNKKDGDDKPSVFWEEDTNTRKLTPTKYQTGDGQIGDWKILLHHNQFYKINDVIKQPRDEGVFIETAFYKSQLKNLIGKWYWAVQGCIEYVSATAWYCKNS